MSALSGGRKASRSGRTGSVVVLLHGYGADGNDLLGLSDPLGAHLPDTVFLAPDAPQRCIGNPMGYQWFPIPWIDGSDPATAARAMATAVDDLNAYLDDVLIDEAIEADRLVLLGFSQGTMMALHVAPRRQAAVAAVVGFSGRLIEPELAGARSAVGRGLVGVIVGEFYAATAGIGYRIIWFGDMFEHGHMFVCIITVMLIAVVFTEGIRWAERAAFPWRVGE